MSKLDQIAEKYNQEEFIAVNEEMSFSEYLDKCYQNPKLVRTAYQRIYDTIVSKGYTEVERGYKSL